MQIDFHNKTLVIFGTGDSSQILTKHLLQNSVSPEYYVDNDSKRWGTFFCGKPVQSPDTLVSEKRPIQILVASAWYVEISAQLNKMNLTENIDYFDSSKICHDAFQKEYTRRYFEQLKKEQAALFEITKNNSIFKNACSGKRCFIIGNGPSISQQDLTRIGNETKIVVNAFYKHPQIKLINPQYWVVADPKFWTEPDAFLYPLLQAIYDLGINSRLFLPVPARTFVQRFQKSVDVYFFQYDQSVAKLQEIDFSTAIPPLGQNVIIPAMMLAMYMGCREIYLLGCDHTWWGFTEETYIEDSSIYQTNGHFYGEPGLGIKALHEEFSFQKLSQTFQIQKEQYAQLREYGDQNGFRIYNATHGGFLESFPRVNYESLF